MLDIFEDRWLRSNLLIVILPLIHGVCGLVKHVEYDLTNGSSTLERQFMGTVVTQLNCQVAPPARFDHGVLDGDSHSRPRTLIVYDTE